MHELILNKRLWANIINIHFYSDNIGNIFHDETKNVLYKNLLDETSSVSEMKNSDS